jgi:hypothetical protein
MHTKTLKQLPKSYLEALVALDEQTKESSIAQKHLRAPRNIVQPPASCVASITLRALESQEPEL